ncbi:C2 domain-containing protein [Durusdinium trenchii]|uniref:C2 domain-containing protein n=1 Tax=Durusdinium trenchii TaxID=1381693 RepID=A0ABP0QN05_9DINO
MFTNYGDERVKLLKKVQTKDDFSAKKWRCLTHPTRAMETLSPYAVLEAGQSRVGILAARDLTERDPGYFSTDTAPDSFVQGILDDFPLEKCKTTVARAKKEPMWIFTCEVEIMAPMSMLRFQVKDNRPETESCRVVVVADCGLATDDHRTRPLDRLTPSPWVKVREETKTEDQFQEFEKLGGVRGKGGKEKKEELEKKSSSTAITDVPDDDHETKLVQKKERYSCSQDRTMDAFQACVHSTADKAQELGLQTLGSAITEGGRKRRRNAGELYVSLRLKLLVSKVSSCFAYALDPPRLEHYGAWKQEVPGIRRAKVWTCPQLSC